MTTIIEAKLKKSDDQLNMDKYGVAAKITEYLTKSKLIVVRITIYLLKLHVKMSNINIFKMDVRTF